MNNLGGSRQDQIEGTIAELRRLGVQRIAPCHCTGDGARRIFAYAFGADCTLVGVGWTVRIGVGQCVLAQMRSRRQWN